MEVALAFFFIGCVAGAGAYVTHLCSQMAENSIELSNRIAHLESQVRELYQKERSQ